MWQIKQALKDITARLTEAGVENCAREATTIVEKATGLSEAQQLAHPDTVVTDAQEANLMNWLRRREAHEPLAYVLGEAQFLGETFICDQRALIPRPETELLVEKVSQLIIAHQMESGRFVDIGTGSGVIAISLKMSFQVADVTAIDNSSEALNLAEQNAREHSAKIHFAKSDLLENVAGRFDLIIANLPYVPIGQWSKLPKEIRLYEPKEAIVAGSDGMSYIRRLLKDAPKHLTQNGTVALETYHTHRKLIEQIVRRHLPSMKLTVVKDLAGIDRFAILENS